MVNVKPFNAADYLQRPESRERLLADAEQSGHAGYQARAKAVVAEAERRFPAQI